MPHDVEQAVAEFRARLQRPDLPVLLAVSGGADSTAMARAWAATQRPEHGRLVIAHWNHGWRGDESDRDEAFVAELAVSLGTGWELGRAPRLAQVDNGQAGPGMPTGFPRSEAAARRQRYAFFVQAARRTGTRYVATAHTADDQAETILLRLLRGTGIAGLAGIPRFRRLDRGLTVVRPLLDLRRDTLQQYLAGLGQTYRVDSSNADPRYLRNRIRAHLLPWLEADFSPAIVEQLRRIGTAAREVHEYVARHVEQLSTQAVVLQAPHRAIIDVRQLAGVPAHGVRQLFVDVWSRMGWPAGQMNRHRWLELAQLAARAASTPPQVGPRMFPGGVRVSWSDGRLVLVRDAEPSLGADT